MYSEEEEEEEEYILQSMEQQNIMTTEFENPFRLPSDEQVFLMRDEQRKQAKEERERTKNLPVWAKTTSTMKQQQIRRIKDDDILPGAGAVMNKQSRHSKGLVAAATAAISKDRRREKESMSDFIAKKREMFLVQMSLDTKREEIRKLEEKAQMKEQALKKSELMLEEDAIRFDTFLKENDSKAHEAIKLAEDATKAKQIKLQKIKQLTLEIQQVENEMNKYKEQLEDCERYKQFLDELTPDEYFKTQYELKLGRAKEKRQAKHDQIVNEWEEKNKLIQAEYEEKIAAEKAKAEAEGIRQRKSKKKKKEAEGPVLLPEPEFDDNDEDYLSDTDPPMYFREPEQLLDIFTTLEEQNLFLIQNSQETEQALEELKQTFRRTKSEMDGKTSALSKNIRLLESQILREREKAVALRKRAKASTGEDGQKDLLEKLEERVRHVYEKCGFNAESKPSTLTMLTDLEAKLEDLLTKIEQMPEDFVAKAEKQKENERRERYRNARLKEAEIKYREKLEISMRRAMQAPKKRTGKPIMTRSKPLFRRKKVEAVEVEDEHAADQKYFM